jgi:hypothetical protein
MTIKYLLQPGWVISMRDAQRHFVSARQLAWLYRVPMSECVIEPQWGGTERRGWRKPEGLVELCPRHDGKYELPPGST